MSSPLIDWSRIDERDQGSLYVDFLDAAGSLRPHTEVREALLHRVGNTPGVAADVGCGLGRTVQALAERGWQATGVDLSSAMIDEARRRHSTLDFQVGSALALPFSDGALDLYCSQRIWMHLPQAQVGPALAEARRVLRPGGRIATVEPDFETLVYPCSDAHRSTARAAREILVDSFANGHAGSLMRGWLHAAGFEEIAVTHCVEQYDETKVAFQLLVDLGLGLCVERGTVSAADTEALRSDLLARERCGGFCATVTMFITTARAPRL